MNKLTRQAALGGIIAAALFGVGAAYAAPSAQDLYGTAIAVGQLADRTIVVTPSTTSVNVDSGETIRLLVQSGDGYREVIWRFDGMADKMPLRAIMEEPSASAGASGLEFKDIPVYVNQTYNPLHSSGGGE